MYSRLVELSQETYLCPSLTGYITPVRALNTAGKWRIIVNGVKAHYETLSQTARVEECTTGGEACPLVPACYNTRCLQKNIYHRYIITTIYNFYSHSTISDSLSTIHTIIIFHSLLKHSNYLHRVHATMVTTLMNTR